MKMSELNMENRSCLTCQGMCRTKREIMFTIKSSPDIDPIVLTEVLKIVAEKCQGYKRTLQSVGTEVKTHGNHPST